MVYETAVDVWYQLTPAENAKTLAGKYLKITRIQTNIKQAFYLNELSVWPLTKPMTVYSENFNYV